MKRIKPIRGGIHGYRGVSMEPKSNVIDIWERRREMEKAETALGKKNTLPSPRVSPGTGAGAGAKKSSSKNKKSEVVDFDSRREAARNTERRIAKRTVLTEFVGCFIVIPQHGLRRVNMHDISESGIAFDVETQFGQFKTGEEVAARIYLSQKSYFPFTVKVTNIRNEDEFGMIRHGAVIQSAENEDALYHFIRFVESVSETLQHDEGDMVAPAHR